MSLNKPRIDHEKRKVM